ncbi:MAG: sodium:solute symporter, partial [Yaniella sp.]|nr:sodium:solute symporter [Yaniella sp.]
MEWLNPAIIIVYLIAMVMFGFWGKRRTKDVSDYLVAGRRLGPVFYTATLVTVVLGGASAVGGVGLGYEHGISGMWMVGAIGIGIIILSLAFAPLLQKLKIYTVVQMLTLRYGHESTQGASLVMLAYTMMICATSTGAYASIFVVLFDWDRWLSVLVGGSVVLIYSVIGGMFSITLADVVQFVVMTVGLF